MRLVARRRAACDVAVDAGLEVGVTWRGTIRHDSFGILERRLGRPGLPFGIVRPVSVPASQIRLLLVEDVAQVAQYIRNLLNAQDQVQAARRR